MQPADRATGRAVAGAEHAAPVARDLDDLAQHGVQRLLAMQEGERADQWPYQGVYREDRGQLPSGGWNYSRTGPGGYAYSAPANPLGDRAEDSLGMMDKTPGSAGYGTALAIL